MMDDLTLLRGAFAVAMADGVLRRSEKGVLQGLARRAGIGKASFDAMLEAAERGEDLGSAALMSSPEAARAGLELLVAHARIDGTISTEEREVLVRIALDMGIEGDEFQSVYTAGVARADALRKARGHD